MFSLLFKRKPPLDEPSVDWLFDVFAWSLKNFPADVFYRQTRLVLPTNEFFPGRVNSVQGMAELVFQRVAEYAGLAHWPWQVLEQNQCYLEEVRHIPSGAVQAFAGEGGLEIEGQQPLPVLYDRSLVANPEALIAGFAHTLAQYLGQTAKDMPPGGVENWPQVTEVLAVYLGFGLMFANSAFVFPSGGCRSCASDIARNGALSQWDLTYALALFASLKDISFREVRPHLKKSLRGYYQRCLTDIGERPGFEELRQLDDVASPVAAAKLQHAE